MNDMKAALRAWLVLVCAWGCCPGVDAASLPQVLSWDNLLAGWSLETGAMASVPHAMPGQDLPKPVAVPYGAGEGGLELKGLLSFWTQDCTKGCGLPRPAGPSQHATASLVIPSHSGEAASTKVQGEAELEAQGKLKAGIAVYAVCPRTTRAPGATSSCPGLYFQVQVELSGAAQAFCGAALDSHDISPFPVLVCGGMSKTTPGMRLGITLHRAALRTEG
ncbi:MAG: hypothetical protein HY924_04115 [Elusimicrobia bacterium]|nr:hypothetical protein [Elusimicrobiota bacterium]